MCLCQSSNVDIIAASLSRRKLCQVAAVGVCLGLELDEAGKNASMHQWMGLVMREGPGASG